MDDNNIIVKITGEADFTEAQLQLREMTDRGKELESEMARLATAEKADIENLNAWIKDEKRRNEEIEKTTSSYRKQRTELQQQINANNKSINSLKSSISTYNALQGSGSKLMMQIRQLREQLSQMEQAGDTSSEAFIELSVQAARLQDQMGDTQQQIAILASDTRNLDAAMSLGSGLAGAFNVATSAAALFGDENEKLQEAFYKVQAVMAILNGLQQTANALNKDSAANVVIRTALQKAFNKAKADETKQTIAGTVASGADTAAKTAEATATGAATTATWSFNAALAANPVGIVVASIAALVAIIYGAVRAFGAAGKAAREFKNAQKELDLQTANSTFQLNEYEKAHDKVMRNIDSGERNALNAAKQRHATTLEQLNIELKYLKQRADEQSTYTEKALQENNTLQIAANKAFAAAEKNLNNQRKGSKAYKEVLEERNKAERNMHEIYQRGTELIQARDDANQAVFEKEQEIANETLNITKQIEQSRINVMKEGQDKELAQLEFTYNERLETVKKGSDLETAILAEKQKEENAIRRKYALQAQSIMLEQLKNESDAAEDNLTLKQAYFEAEAQYKIAQLDKETMAEEDYANKVEAINLELKEKIRNINSERLSETYGLLQSQYQREMNMAQETLDSNRSSLAETLNARKEYKQARDAMLDAEEAELRERYNNQDKYGIMSEVDYNNELERITHERIENQIADEQAYFDRVTEIANQVLSTIGEIGNMVFEAVGNNIQAQVDALDEMYTTDAAEAKENANKKYITEKELAQKKAALQLKQQRLNKASALFEIGLNTASAIIGFLKNPGGYVGIALAATAGIMGATQLGIAAGKPLPQYAKGRKGGKGEFAMVGERGAELMYVPDGASIIPNNKLNMPQTWGDYGIPQLPSVDKEFATLAVMGSMGIDYNKLGKAVADNIPQQKAVNVNIDRDGITVSEGGNVHHVLNQKYVGSWI